MASRRCKGILLAGSLPAPLALLFVACGSFTTEPTESDAAIAASDAGKASDGNAMACLPPSCGSSAPCKHDDCEKRVWDERTGRDASIARNAGRCVVAAPALADSFLEVGFDQKTEMELDVAFIVRLEGASSFGPLLRVVSFLPHKLTLERSVEGLKVCHDLRDSAGCSAPKPITDGQHAIRMHAMLSTSQPGHATVDIDCVRTLEHTFPAFIFGEADAAFGRLSVAIGCTSSGRSQPCALELDDLVTSLRDRP